MAFNFDGDSVICFPNPYQFQDGEPITYAVYFNRPGSAPNLYEYLLTQQTNDDTLDSASNTNFYSNYALVLPNNTGGTKIRVLGFTDSTAFFTETSSNDWAENVWELYVFSFNGNKNASNQSKIWRNGIQVSETTTTSGGTLTSNTGMWTIGGRFLSGVGLSNNTFTGRIEYMAIWNQFLDDEEAKALSLRASPLSIRQQDLVFFINGQSATDIIDIVSGRKGAIFGGGVTRVRGPAMTY